MAYSCAGACFGPVMDGLSLKTFKRKLHDEAEPDFLNLGIGLEYCIEKGK
jgi:hypothetical protein